MRLKAKIALFLTLGWAGMASAQQQEAAAEEVPLAPEQQEVKQIFQSYKTALLEGDGDSAAHLVDHQTFEYFETLQSLALTGDAEAVRSRAFVDRLLIVTMRHELDAATLAEMGLEDLLRHAIESGWIAKASIRQLDIGEISVDGDDATAEATVGGSVPPAAEGVEPLAYEFIREEGQWKFRFGSLVTSLNRVISDFTAQLGADEDDMIFTLVQALSGRQVLPEVWNAPAGLGVGACEPDGDVQFVCGPVSPEDLMAVPQTPWLIVSGMENDGSLYLVDTRDHTTQVLYPAQTSSSRHDVATFGSCTQVVSRFRPHGLSLRPGDSGIHTLYVVRHGAREAIEVFEVDARDSAPTLTWMGCVLAPEAVSLNSVVALPGGGFAVTNFQIAGGELWEWQPEAGWAKVPGSETSGPNGIEASPDGRWFYIGGWGTESLIRLSRGQTPVQKDSVEVGFHIDNVRWAPDGSLFAAGHSGGGITAIGACLSGGSCEGVATRVARVDPDELTAEEIVRYPSSPLLPLGTVAIRVGEEIWVGAVGGGDRIARFPVPAR